MTVVELIEKLNQMPQDAMVVVRGYEDGVDEVDSIKECDVLTDYYEESYYGAHEIVGDLSFGWYYDKYNVTEESPGLYRFSSKLSYDESFWKTVKEPFYCKCVGAVYIWSSMQGYSRKERKEQRALNETEISE